MMTWRSAANASCSRALWLPESAEAALTNQSSGASGVGPVVAGTPRDLRYANSVSAAVTSAWSMAASTVVDVLTLLLHVTGHDDQVVRIALAIFDIVGEQRFLHKSEVFERSAGPRLINCHVGDELAQRERTRQFEI